MTTSASGSGGVRFELTIREGNQFGQEYTHDVPGFDLNNTSNGGQTITSFTLQLDAGSNSPVIFDAGYPVSCSAGSNAYSIIEPDMNDTGGAFSSRLSYAFGGISPSSTCSFHADLDWQPGIGVDYRDELPGAAVLVEFSNGSVLTGTLPEPRNTEIILKVSE